MRRSKCTGIKASYSVDAGAGIEVSVLVGVGVGVCVGVGVGVNVMTGVSVIVGNNHTRGYQPKLSTYLSFFGFIYHTKSPIFNHSQQLIIDGSFIDPPARAIPEVIYLCAWSRFVSTSLLISFPAFVNCLQFAHLRWHLAHG